jgi:hypothetical protein
LANEVALDVLSMTWTRSQAAGFFIQVTSDGTEAPIRHTVSWAGAAALAAFVPADDEPLEPQPAIASAAAAPSVASAAGVFLSPTVLALLPGC